MKLFTQLAVRVELWIRTHPFFKRTPLAQRIFFPGCSLTSSFPELVNLVHEELQKINPKTALWLDCCGAPLRMFVSVEAAHKYKRAYSKNLAKSGVKEIVTACGNCFLEFNEYVKEIPDLRVIPVYDELEGTALAIENREELLVHHPCPARKNAVFRSSFEVFAEKLGLPNGRGETDGGLPCCLVHTPPALKRREKLKGKRLLTYCAHCTGVFQSDIPSTHILEYRFNQHSAPLIKTAQKQ